MRGFLYQIASEAGAWDPGMIQTAGLAYAFGGDTEAVQVLNGPGGRPGFVVTNAGDAHRKIGYFPKQQTWQKQVGEKISAVWIGMWTDSPPVPAELEREQILSGYIVELGDGNEWMIPLVRPLVPDGTTLAYQVGLPTRAKLTDAGEWEPGPVVEKYRELWELTEAWWADFTETAEEKALRQYSGITKGAALALAANYRIGPREADMLELFDIDKAREILNALIDVPTLKKWMEQKKKDGSPVT